MRRCLPLFLVPLALAACGGGGSSSPNPPPPVTTGPPPPPPPLPTTQTTAGSSTTTLTVYFLRNGKVAAARRVVPATQRVAAAALSALAEGPTAAEAHAGLRSAVPRSAGGQAISISDGVAHLESENLGRAAMAQITYTLTRFPTVRSVQFGEKRFTRGGFESLTPAILVESPVVGETIRSPARLRGTANTFEATFEAELRAAGRRVFKETVTATSGSGTRGTFDVVVPYKISRAADGLLIVYELSAASGRPVNVVRIPVRVDP